MKYALLLSTLLTCYTTANGLKPRLNFIINKDLIVLYSSAHNMTFKVPQSTFTNHNVLAILENKADTDNLQTAFEFAYETGQTINIAYNVDNTRYQAKIKTCYVDENKTDGMFYVQITPTNDTQ